MFWVHKNDSLEYGTQDSYSQPVIPVCIDDKITLSFKLFNGNFLDYGELHQPKIGELEFKFEMQKLPSTFKNIDRGQYFKPNI